MVGAVLKRLYAYAKEQWMPELSTIRNDNGEEEDAGGITCLELYLLYARHGGNEDEEEKERSPGQATADAAAAGRVQAPHAKNAKHAISESDEWQMQTDNARKPRLKAIAVEGSAPAIRGMPVKGEEDAKAIVSAILAMRGVDKNKQTQRGTGTRHA